MMKRSAYNYVPIVINHEDYQNQRSRYISSSVSMTHLKRPFI